MNAADLTFEIKDVVGIVLAVLAVVGFLYALKRTAEKANEQTSAVKKELDDYKKSVEEKFLHAKNSKKANIQMIMDIIKTNKEEVEKKENQIYARMNEIREEEKLAHDKLSDKIDSVVTMQQTMNASLAELTGFLKGKRNDEHR